MTCKGDALKYVRIHHETGSVYIIWNELKKRYDGVEHNDLQDLNKKIVDTIAVGPGDDDPLPKAKKGGGKLKDEAEILVLIKRQMRECRHYSSCASALKAAFGTKNKDYDEIKDYYREHWFENIMDKKMDKNEALFVKKYGYKYFFR
jgi:hypothetical protein